MILVERKLIKPYDLNANHHKLEISDGDEFDIVLHFVRLVV